MKVSIIWWIALFAVSLTHAPFLASQQVDWPQFRGPNSSGKSEETKLPLTWDETKNIVWKTGLPGRGASSPVTFGDKIYVTCYSGIENNSSDFSSMKRHLLCIRRNDGQVVWDQQQASTADQEPYQSFTLLHGYASGTPAVDQTGVYVFYGTSGAAKYDHDGKQVWRVDCGNKHHVFGTSNSPVLFDNLVIINASVECGDLIALEKESGKEVWRAAGMDMSWNTPTLVKTADGNTELVVHVKGKVLGFDPKTGEALWNCAGIPDYICPSVLAEGDVVYAIGGRQNMALAIRSGGRGDVSESHVLWKIRKGSNVVSPVLLDGYLYWAKEEPGIAYCVNAEDGKIAYEKRIPGIIGKLYASPIAADGKIYYVSRESGTYVLAAKPEFEQLAHNQIDSDASIFNGSPVVSNGDLILRSDKFLYCIGNR
jgi:hypothetical protein